MYLLCHYIRYPLDIQFLFVFVSAVWTELLHISNLNKHVYVYPASLLLSKVYTQILVKCVVMFLFFEGRKNLQQKRLFVPFFPTQLYTAVLCSGIVWCLSGFDFSYGCWFRSGSISYPKLYVCWKARNIFWLLFTAMSVYIVFIFLVSVIAVLIYQYSGQNIKIFWKKV